MPAQQTPAQDPAYPQGIPPLPQSAPQMSNQPQDIPVSEHFASKPEYSVDYLNSIAPNETPKKISPLILFGGIAGVIILAIVAVFAMSPKTVDFSTQAKDLQMRIATLQAVSDAQSAHLKETEIVTANATLRSTMTSMNSSLVALMKARKLNPPKDASATLSASEKTYKTNLIKELDDYYQLGTLDRNYGPQIAYEVTLLRSKVTKLKATSNSKSVDEYCDKAASDLDVISKMLSEFTSTK